LSEKPAERRNFLKYAATAIVCGVVAGVGGYFGGAAAVPAAAETTVTKTVGGAAESVTVTKTVPGVAKPTGEPFVLGWMGSFDSDAAKGSMRGVELAVEEINAAGGVLGRPIEIVKADSKEDVEEGIKVYDFLAETAKADFIVSGAVDDVTNAFMSRIPEHKIPTIDTWTTSAVAIGMVGEDYDNYKPYFMPTTNDYHFGHGMVQFTKDVLVEKQGYTKCVLLQEDTSFGQGVGEWFSEILPEAGVEIVDTIVYDVDTMDFSPHFARCRASGADYIHAIASVKVLSMAMQYVTLEVPLPLVGCIVAAQFDEWWEDTGGKGRGMVHMHYAPGSYGKLDERSQKVMAMYNAKYQGARPKTMYCASWQGYYMTHFMCQAAERAEGFCRPGPGEPVDTSIMDAFVEEMENGVLVSGYLEDRRPCWKFSFQKLGEKDPYIGGEWPHLIRYDPTGVDGMPNVYMQWFPDPYPTAYPELRPQRNCCIWPERYAVKEFRPPAEL